MKWIKPVRPGDHLTLRRTILEKRVSNSRPEMGFVKFDYALMAPRLGRAEVEAIFGHDLFSDGDNRPGFEDIVGLGVHKPFECVGEYYEAAESLLAVFDDEEWHGVPLVEQFRARRSEVEAVAAKHDDGPEVDYVPARYAAAPRCSSQQARAAALKF